MNITNISVYGSNISSINYDGSKFSVTSKDGRSYEVQLYNVSSPLKGISTEAFENLSKSGYFNIHALTSADGNEYSIEFKVRFSGGGNNNSCESHAPAMSDNYVHDCAHNGRDGVSIMDFVEHSIQRDFGCAVRDAVDLATGSNSYSGFNQSAPGYEPSSSSSSSSSSSYEVSAPSSSESASCSEAERHD